MERLRPQLEAGDGGGEGGRAEEEEGREVGVEVVEEVGGMDAELWVAVDAVVIVISD